MTCRTDKLLSVLLFAPGIFFFSNTLAQAQACTPVLYLFRHAEDKVVNRKNVLTDSGMKHAKLYPDMIELLEKTYLTSPATLCPVQRVFAMWDRQLSDTDIRGTTNPFYTALPLAQKVKIPPTSSPVCPPPTTTPPLTGYTPEMCFQDDGYPMPGTHKYYLCEHINEDPNDPNTCENNAGIDPKEPDRPHRNALLAYSGDTNSHFYSYLLAYFQVNPTSSVAIFYTSQGMPDVSQALGAPPIVVGDPDPNVRGWPGLLRNSVNIFTFDGNTFVKNYPNPPPPTRDKVVPVQCFTFSRVKDYACQTSGGGLAEGDVPADGVMCLAVIPDTSRGDIYGYCKRPGAPPAAAQHDIDGNTISDIVWRDTSGDIAVWLMNGAGVASSAGLGNLPTTWSIVGQRDFDGDGTADLLWRDTSGNTAIWFMNGTTVASTAGVGNIPTNWTVVATGDFNGDGMGDILWQDTSGNLAVWLMNGATVSASGGIGNVPANWTLAGTGDFDGDGKTDLLWRDNLGNTAIWFMNGTTGRVDGRARQHPDDVDGGGHR